MLDDTDDLRRRLASPALVASLLGLAADPVVQVGKGRLGSPSPHTCGRASSCDHQVS